MYSKPGEAGPPGLRGASAPSGGGRGSGRRPCCVLPLWVLLSLGVGSLSTLSALSVFGIMFSAQTAQRNAYNSLLAGVALSGMRNAADALGTSLADASAMVRFSVPAAASCALPLSDFDPTPLARLFNSFTLGAPEMNLASVGLVRVRRAREGGGGGGGSGGGGCARARACARAALYRRRPQPRPAARAPSPPPRRAALVRVQRFKDGQSGLAGRQVLPLPGLRLRVVRRGACAVSPARVTAAAAAARGAAPERARFARCHAGAALLFFPPHRRQVIYPRFLGHCVSSATLATNFSDSAYVGQDYGLDANEAALLSGAPGARLYNPIAPVYPGSPYTLTQYTSYSCAASATSSYALTFAEQSLDQLTLALEALIANTTSLGTIFFVERQTGVMVASSTRGQVAGAAGADGRESRIAAVAAPDAAVRGAAALLAPFAGSVPKGTDAALPSAPVVVESDTLWVAAAGYADANLDWALVAVIPKTTFLQAVAQASALSIGLSIAVVAVGTALVVAFVYCFISLPLARMRDAFSRYDRLKATADDAPAGDGGAAPAGGEPGARLLLPGEDSSVREINDLAQSLASYSSRLRAANGLPTPPAATSQRLPTAGGGDPAPPARGNSLRL